MDTPKVPNQFMLHRCLGSTQHLKNKYGGGYMLEVKLKQRHEAEAAGSDREWEAVEAEVTSQFADTLLSEAFADRRMYSIPQTSVSSLATAFSKLEECECQNYDLTKELEADSFKSDWANLFIRRKTTY